MKQKVEGGGRRGSRLVPFGYRVLAGGWPLPAWWIARMAERQIQSRMLERRCSRNRTPLQTTGKDVPHV